MINIFLFVLLGILLSTPAIIAIRQRDGAWYHYTSYRMRRRVNGAWQVREMTPDEVDLEARRRAW